MNLPFVAVEVGFVRMQQAHTGADLSIPTDERRPVLDEAALLGRSVDLIAHEGQVLISLEQAIEGFAGDGTDIEAREAHLDLARGEGEGVGRERQPAEHLFFHVRAVGEDVADQDPVGADLARQFIYGFEIVDVSFHDDEGDPDIDLAPPRAFFPEEPQAIDEALESGAFADRFEPRFVRPVEGDPQPVQAVLEQAVEHGFIEQGAVGRHFGADAERLDLPDHGQDIRVGRRFPESAEHHRFEALECFELADEPVEGLPFHVAQGLVPGVADAGLTGQVAARGRLDINPGQGVKTRPDLDETPVFDDLEPILAGRAQLSEKPGWKNQGAVFSEANLMHPDFFLSRRSVAPDFFEFSHPTALTHLFISFVGFSAAGPKAWSFHGSTAAGNRGPR